MCKTMFRRLSEWFLGLFSTDKEGQTLVKEEETISEQSDILNNAKKFEEDNTDGKGYWVFI